MTVINTNISATLASNAIKQNDRDMTTAMERLSTGLRINSAGDDAAGLAISARMTSQVKGLEQAARNANDGIALLQVAEGAVSEISNMLGRMKELAIQASSGTYSDTDRAALDLELQQLFLEIQRISVDTEWNGISILNGADDGGGNPVDDSTVTATSINLQVGAGSNQTMTLSLKSWDPRSTFNVADLQTGIGSGMGALRTSKISQVGETDASAYGEASLVHDWDGGNDEVGVQISTGTDNTLDKYINIQSIANAEVVLVQIDKAITAAAAERAKLGAYINRLEYAQDNLMNVAQNTDASRSRIEDADYAAETSELARTQIISQASTAMLAQANQSKQSVLALLQG